MTDISEWQGRVGRSWADEWRRTDRSFGNLTDRLLGRASARPIAHALDIGCGAGELSLALARGHTNARITGLDISPELVAIAQERSAHLSNVRFLQADAASWKGSGTPAPNLIVSRHGVMFFPDPQQAFSNLAKVAADDARLVFSCFRSRDDNPWAERIAGLLPVGMDQTGDPFAPGPFAFADRAYVEALLSDSGWLDISFEQVDFAYIAGAGEDPVADAAQFFQRIGPAARAAAQLSGDQREVFLGRLNRFLENQRDGSLVALPASAWIVTARPR